jgi:hypothetical protein
MSSIHEKTRGKKSRATVPLTGNSSTREAVNLYTGKSINKGGSNHSHREFHSQEDSILFDREFRP